MREQTFRYNFNVEQTLSSIVSIKAHIPENSFSADLLGTERTGHGIVLREDGLIVTIGYVITEAEMIWIGTNDDRTIPGYIVANDYDTGFGLVKPLSPIGLPPMKTGKLNSLTVDDTVLIAGHGGPGYMMESTIVARHEFAGRWEYLLDEAIFTAPVYSDWAGAALIGANGRLYGVGCLLIQDVAPEDDPMAGTNMFVPVETLEPVLDELCRYGGRRGPPRPWLGALIQEELGQLIAVGVFHKCPADQAGIRPGDMISAVDEEPVTDLAGFYRKIWSYGPAGVEIPISITRESRNIEIIVKTSDRESSLRRGPVN